MDSALCIRAGALVAICASSMLAAPALAHDGCGAHQSGTSYFGPLDVEVGDTVKLKLVAPPTFRDSEPDGRSAQRPGEAGEPTGVPVTVRFFDSSGAEVATMSRRLAPGSVDSIELAGRSVPPDDTGGTSLWATLSVDSPQGHSPGAVAVQLEVTDGESSQFLNPATLVFFNPQPEPPGHF